VPPRISLALAIHNHQPVGNFGWVIAEVFERAYAPLLEALERHRSVHVALHYSGPLLDWLRAERPDFVDRLRAIVARGQVEILGGGYYEPVLASLPERDRVGQLRRMAEEIELTFGRRPRGAWLAERVWEPSLPTSLVAGGYDWTILDDAHFRSASIPEDRIWGAHTTEDQGDLLTLLGTDQDLRRLIPFGEVDEVIAHLRANATLDGSRVGVMGDDGEKFGAWPTTWEHCWGEGRWVERFLDALEANADWLTTVIPSAWLADHPPTGRAYVPTGSYAEMGEWSLPPDEARAFAAAVRRAEEDGRPERRWLRGGFWRNFQVKYREINDLHKQMLRVSARVEAMPAGPARDRARDHLYRGQSNDCYWHGLFGGIYLGHMRLATYAHLIAAEDLADGTDRTRPRGELIDVDLDGIDEALLVSSGQTVAVDIADGAAIASWDVRAVRHALTAIVGRHPEAAHETLRTQAEAGPDDGSAGTIGSAASIHDLVRVKEAGLAGQLRHDPYERRSALVRVLAPSTTAAGWADGSAAELGDFVGGAFEVAAIDDTGLRVTRDGRIDRPAGPVPVRVAKSLTLAGDRRSPRLELQVTVENRGDASAAARLGVEWNLMMLGGGANPAAWYEADGTRSAHDSSGTLAGVTTIGQGNDDVGLALETNVSPAADAWWTPIETISSSESGVERSYQGSALLLSWMVELGAGERREFRIRHTVTTARDWALEEAATAVGDPERAEA